MPTGNPLIDFFTWIRDQLYNAISEPAPKINPYTPTPSGDPITDAGMTIISALLNIIIASLNVLSEAVTQFLKLLLLYPLVAITDGFFALISTVISWGIIGQLLVPIFVFVYFVTAILTIFGLLAITIKLIDFLI